MKGCRPSSSTPRRFANVYPKSTEPKKIEKQRDFKAPQALLGDTELTARAANVLNSVAKVQHNFETAKDKEQKRTATVELQNTNLIA